MDMITVTFIGIGIGIFLAFQSQRRRFDRTNQFGVERFHGYWHKVRARASDHALRGASFLCLAVGTALLTWVHLETWGWIAIVPLSAIALYALVGS